MTTTPPSFIQGGDFGAEKGDDVHVTMNSVDVTSLHSLRAASTIYCLTYLLTSSMAYPVRPQDT